MTPILEFVIEGVEATPVLSGLGVTVTVRPSGDMSNGVTCGAARFFFTVHDEATAEMLLREWHEFCTSRPRGYLSFPLAINIGNLMWPKDSEES